MTSQVKVGASLVIVNSNLKKPKANGVELNNHENERLKPKIRRARSRSRNQLETDAVRAQEKLVRSKSSNRSSVEELKKIKSKNYEMRLQLHELEETNKELNSELSTSKEEVKHLVHELDCMRTEANSNTNVIDKLMLEHKNLKEEHARLLKTRQLEKRQVNKSLKLKISGLEKNLTRLKTELNQSGDYVTDLQEQLQEEERKTSIEIRKRTELEIEVKNLTMQISDLQIDFKKVQTELVQKEDQFSDLQKLLLLKEFRLSSEHKKRTKLEADNKNLTSKILNLQINLTRSETDNEIWNSEYQNLQNELSKYKTELDSDKSCNVAMKITELRYQMGNLSIAIDNATKNLCKQANAERRTWNVEIDEMISDYKRMNGKLTNHDLTMPNLNFGVLLDKYRKIRKQNDAALKASLRNVCDIKQDFKYSRVIVDETIKAVGDATLLIDKHLNALHDLMQISFEKEFKKEEKLYEEVKAAYEEAKVYFVGALKYLK